MSGNARFLNSGSVVHAFALVREVLTHAAATDPVGRSLSPSSVASGYSGQSFDTRDSRSAGCTSGAERGDEDVGVTGGLAPYDYCAAI